MTHKLDDRALDRLFRTARTLKNEAVDSESLADTRVKSNFICSIGYGSNENLFPGNQRLTFEEAGRFA
jgi:hypothetical protein